MSASREVYLVKLYLDRLPRGPSTAGPALSPERSGHRRRRRVARALFRQTWIHSRATVRRVLRWVRARAIR